MMLMSNDDEWNLITFSLQMLLSNLDLDYSRRDLFRASWLLLERAFSSIPSKLITSFSSSTFSQLVLTYSKKEEKKKREN